jgi:RHS repeat-associated protein
MTSATTQVSTNLFGYAGFDLVTETQNGVTITRSYDSLGRATGFNMGTGYAVAYGYDTFGRFAAVSSSVAAAYSVADYSYVAGSDLVASMTNSAGFSWARAYEQDRALIAGVENRFNDSVLSGFTYHNDEGGRRTERVDSGLVTNVYWHNSRSEIIGAVIGDDLYGYSYDSIGNWEWAGVNTDTNTYAANNLNQYTAVAAVTPQYDADGNLTAVGQLSLTWDAENRNTVVLSNGNPLVANSYDPQHRRVIKTTPAAEHTFLYDGWLPVLEKIVLSNGTVEVREHVWGKDLSGTRGGAGGVGGLLATRIGEAWYFPLYDNNGNITDYIAESGATVAHREYDPFGRTTVATGTMVNDFNFWFSTKYLDHETGQYYYGRRFYSPQLLRWLNRDPVEEGGGANLYGVIGNNPVNGIDPLGLKQHSMTFDFTNPSEYNWLRRNIYEPWDKIFVREKAEIIRKIKSTINSKTCDCIKTLNLSAHGSGAGNIVFGDNWYMSSQNDLLEKDDTSLGERQLAIKRQMEQMVAFLSTRGTYLCKNSTVTFVICGAGAGDEGSALRNQLVRVFPAGTKVVLFSGTCGFVYGIPTAQNGDPGKTGR